MCETCGCQDHKQDLEKKVIINKSVTELNDVLANHIQSFLLEKHILCVNLMGSPGSGKTAVIEGLLRYIDVSDIAVIQGDLESDLDKKRLEKKGVLTYQINTHSGCHLTSAMINKALYELDVQHKKYLLIENVGNLVCPAGVKIGQHVNVVVSSTTEGADKPKKYPYVFMDADLVVISKYDVVEYVDFNVDGYLQDIRNINANVTIVKTSTKDPDSFKNVISFFEHKRDHLLGKSHKHK